MNTSDHDTDLPVDPAHGGDAHRQAASADGPAAPMSREELLELAALDAFGLLDKYEAALFTRSFHRAPAAMQKEIMELQAGSALDAPLLPDVEPAAGLRQRVLETVAGEIAKEQVELAPLATIGPSPKKRLSRGERLRSGNSASFWRAAAFLLAASHLVVAYFVIELNKNVVVMTQEVLRNGTEQAVIELFGVDPYRDFVTNPTSVKTALHSVTGPPATAWIYVREDRGDGWDILVKTEGLAPKSNFLLKGVDADGNVIERSFVTGAGVITAQFFSQVPALTSTVTWTITTTAGQTVLRKA